MDNNFVDGVDPDSDAAEFYATSQKGVVRSSQSSGGSGGSRASSAPKDEIENHRDIAYTDPHVHEALETLTDWIVGDGFNVQPRNFEAAMESGVGAEAANVAQGGNAGDTGETQNSATNKVQSLRRLLKQSEFWKVFNDWVRYALIDGHAFMELVVENETFKPKLLPTERMKRKLDKYGNVKRYELEKPGGGGGGGGGGGNDTIKYKPHEVAELWFRKEPTDDFGRSFVEPVSEQADMLRDMEIDYARFIATKAYPPILWKLGDENNNWTDDQVQAWMDNVQTIEPDSMLAAPHDVETEVVGTTSTSSTAGAMRLEETFTHLQNRVVTGIGVPALLMNMEVGGQAEATATMPAYKRRVQRLQNIVKQAVEQQILKSLLTESAGLDSFSDTLPEFQFGEHSSAEKRLEIDKLLKLFNNGLLTPEAFAERAGIEPQEMPSMWDEGDLIQILQVLASKSSTGDQIQNPSGGAPTSTGGGAESAGGEVTSRQDPGTDSSSGRNKKSVTEDES